MSPITESDCTYSQNMSSDTDNVTTWKMQGSSPKDMFKQRLHKTQICKKPEFTVHMHSCAYDRKNWMHMFGTLSVKGWNKAEVVTP